MLLTTVSVKLYDRFDIRYSVFTNMYAGLFWIRNIILMNIMRRDLREYLRLKDRRFIVEYCGVTDATGSSTVIHSTVNEFKIKLQFFVMNGITKRMPL